jgi:hypothetical protein
VAARFKVWVCGHPLAGIAGSNPPGALLSVFYEYCVLAGRGLCVEPIPYPEEYYQVCVYVCVRVNECDQVQQQPSVLIMSGRRKERNVYPMSCI